MKNWPIRLTVLTNENKDEKLTNWPNWPSLQIRIKNWPMRLTLPGAQPATSASPLNVSLYSFLCIAVLLFQFSLGIVIAMFIDHDLINNIVCESFLCWSWFNFYYDLKSALAASRRLSTLGIWRRRQRLELFDLSWFWHDYTES